MEEAKKLNEKEEDIDNNEEELKPNKNLDGLFDILEKLKQKKAAENKPKTISKKELNKDEEIDELQNEKKDIENIRKKEIKLEQKTITKGNKKIKEEESNKKSNKNNNLCYNNRRRISNKQIKKNVLNNEELKIRRKLEEDLKAEINKKDSNDLRDDEISTVYSKSNLINNSFSNNNLTQTKKEKQNQKNENSIFFTSKRTYQKIKQNPNSKCPKCKNLIEPEFQICRNFRICRICYNKIMEEQKEDLIDFFSRAKFKVNEINFIGPSRTSKIGVNKHKHSNSDDYNEEKKKQNIMYT